MRAFTINNNKVTKCGTDKTECPNYFISVHDHLVDKGRCFIAKDKSITYKQNRDGITPSCPMYDKAIEVAE